MTKDKKLTPMRVVQFQASDNSMHDTYAGAVKHEHSLEFANWLGAWLEERCYRDAPSGEELAHAIKAAWSVSRRKK